MYAHYPTLGPATDPAQPNCPRSGRPARPADSPLGQVKPSERRRAAGGDDDDDEAATAAAAGRAPGAGVGAAGGGSTKLMIRNVPFEVRS